MSKDKSNDETKEEKNENTTLLIDPSSAYYVHPSDNPGALLVSQLLDGDNHPTWKHSMMVALGAKNKFGFVHGTLEKPSSPTNLAAWERCNHMVFSWLINALSKDLRDSVMFAETTKYLWAELEERFSQGNSPQIYQIRCLIASIKQEHLSVTAYFPKLKQAWDELSSYSTIPTCTCGAMQETQKERKVERVYQFLIGLNEVFGTIRTQTIAMDPLPSLCKFYSMVQQEEKHLGLRGPQPSEATSIAAKETSGNQFAATKPKPRSICDHCGKTGHIKARSYEIVGYPVGHPKHGSSKPTQNQGVFNYNTGRERRSSNFGSETNKTKRQFAGTSNVPSNNNSTVLPHLTTEQHQ